MNYYCSYSSAVFMQLRAYSEEKFLDFASQTEERSELTGMKQSLKGQHGVFEARLMAAGSLDKFTLTDGSVSRGNAADKFKLTRGNKFHVKLLHALSSHPYSRVGKPCCWKYMISLNKERSSDLINHSVWRRRRQRTPREVLLFLPLECAAPSREDAFVFAVGLCCLGCSLPLSHPFNHPYSLRLCLLL